jgi:tetratricopeptide (TPR) repeat protein
LEIVVVDDGSTDDTAALMAQYAERVTYIRQPNQNVAVARNTGFRASSGEYITFLDDDDFILPNKIERQVKVLASRPDTHLVHCGYYYADGDGGLLCSTGLLPMGDVLRQLVRGCFVWVGGPLIRRQCFDQIGCFDQDSSPITADWDMWLRIAQAGYHFACVQEPLGAYRVHPDSMLADVAALERGVLAVLDKVFADPRLPARVRALKQEAYGKMHSWISWRYYAVGQWNDAQRNLAKALALYPQLAEQPLDLARFVSDGAFSPRIKDPFQFVMDVLENLPPSAVGLRRNTLRILSQVYIGLALRNYRIGNIADAKQQLNNAVVLNPKTADQAQDFARLLTDCAVQFPIGSPVAYVETVFQNLPGLAQPLARLRPCILSDVNIASAFQGYFAGHRRLVVSRVLAALRYRPSWLKNRGVVAILVKALLGVMPKESGQE